MWTLWHTSGLEVTLETSFSGMNAYSNTFQFRVVYFIKPFIEDDLSRYLFSKVTSIRVYGVDILENRFFRKLWLNFQIWVLLVGFTIILYFQK